MTNLKRTGPNIFTLTEGVAERPDVYAEWEMTVPYEGAAPCEKCGLAAPISDTYQITLVGAAAGVDYDFIAIRHRENQALPKGQEYMEDISLELTIKSFLEFRYAVCKKRPEIHRRALVDMLIHVRDYALERISRSEELLHAEVQKIDKGRWYGVIGCHEAKRYFEGRRMRLDYKEAMYVLEQLRELFLALPMDSLEADKNTEQEIQK